jgi:hypothetical protein
MTAGVTGVGSARSGGSLHTPDLFVVHVEERSSSSTRACAQCGWSPALQFRRCGALWTPPWDGRWAPRRTGGRTGRAGTCPLAGHRLSTASVPAVHRPRCAHPQSCPQMWVKSWSCVSAARPIGGGGWHRQLTGAPRCAPGTTVRHGFCHVSAPARRGCARRTATPGRPPVGWTRGAVGWFAGCGAATRGSECLHAGDAARVPDPSPRHDVAVCSAVSPCGGRAA